MKRRNMSPSERSSASSKLLTKLSDAVTANKFYEAHQLLKTINFRHTNAGKYDELEELLVKYATILLRNNQIESGCDVAIMLSKLYKDKNFPVVSNRVQEACRLLEVMPSCPERTTFLMTVLEWCCSCDLSAKVHATAVVLYANERCYSEAWKHLIRLNNGVEVSTLAAPILKGCQIRRDEYDLAISSLVLAYLVSKKVEVAEQAFTLLVKDQIHELSPLLNGVRFLIEASKLRCPKAFAAIRDVYEPSFCRDPHIRKLVAMAGKNLFKLSDGCDKPNNSLMPMLLNAFLNPDQSSLD